MNFWSIGTRILKTKEFNPHFDMFHNTFSFIGQEEIDENLRHHEPIMDDFRSIWGTQNCLPIGTAPSQINQTDSV